MFFGFDRPTAAESRLLHRAGLVLGSFTLLTVVAGSISMFFTQRHQPLIVPKVVGLEEGQARRLLSSKGLQLRLGDPQYDEHMPKGLLRTQDPKPNQYIRRGGTVSSSLSKGNPRVKVPTVIRMSSPQAQIALEGARLKVGREALLHSNEPKDAVIAQVPAPGETVDSFTEVNLLVSSGPREPEYVMPILRNQPLERAFKALRPAGITIEKIKSEVRDDLESGTILSQTPPSGTRIKKKDAVSFTVSSRSSEQGQGSRYVKVRFEMPEGNPRRLQIDVFDASGTRTIYNKMESPKEQVEVGVSVSGKASAQVYLNQEFVKEIPIE